MGKVAAREGYVKIRSIDSAVLDCAVSYPLDYICLSLLEPNEYADYICSDFYAVAKQNMAVVLKSNINSLPKGAIVPVSNIVDAINPV